MGWEPGRRSGSAQRPLTVRDGRGREQGRDPKSQAAREKPLLPGPGLLHDPGDLLALGAQLTREWPQPGKIPNLAQESPAQKA